MSQKRYLNFGTDADATKTKAISSQFFAPQMLRADDPFFSPSPPDQLLIQPHSCIFENGIVLVEDEVLTVEISTSFNSADYTIYYEHIDEDQIGGIAASLKIASGLLQSVGNSVILGWVVYPGGSVPLDASMLFTNFKGQVTPGFQFKELTLPSRIATINVESSWLTTDAILPTSTNDTIPSTVPYQITATGTVLSALLLPSKSLLRVYNHDDGADMTRVVSAPGVGEYAVDTNTEVYTFNALDAGKSITIFDNSYGTASRYTNPSASDPGVVDLMFNFPASDALIKNLYVEYVSMGGSFTFDTVEIVDVNGDAATHLDSKSEPLALDGSISRLTIRLVEGIFIGTSGEQFVARLRASLGVSSEGLLLRVRASTYDLPF